MAYDFIRWGFGLLLFIILLVILILTTKKKGRSIIVSAFIAIIISSVLLLFPVENYFYNFSTVEQIFSYRHHEQLLTYAECDSGVLSVGVKNDGSYVFYTFAKSESGYQLMRKDNISYRSSKYGVYLISNFGDETIIMTQVAGSSYDGKNFEPIGNGYYCTIIHGNADISLLMCSGNTVSLV
jgi:hypothetical protein